MADRPDFGKRRPQRLPDLQPEPAQKRSRHVALLVMGAFAVGGGAYAMMDRQNCQPMQTAPGVATPAPPGVAAPAPSQGTCTSRGSSYSGVTHSTRYGFFGSGSSGGSDSASSSVSRGGFGSIAHAFGFGRS
jgi:hypothetical protein